MLASLIGELLCAVRATVKLAVGGHQNTLKTLASLLQASNSKDVTSWRFVGFEVVEKTPNAVKQVLKHTTFVVSNNFSHFFLNFDLFLTELDLYINLPNSCKEKI